MKMPVALLLNNLFACSFAGYKLEIAKFDEKHSKKPFLQFSAKVDMNQLKKLFLFPTFGTNSPPNRLLFKRFYT
ncbi:MAG: hypothetical protein ACLU62_08815 [Hydrogeniiclostridium sp.]